MMDTIKKFSLLLFVMAAIGLASCDGTRNEKEPDDATSMLAGTEHKTWRIKKEVNEVGLREKTTSVERKEEITFNVNSSFVIENDSETRGGKWTYDGADLTLQFSDNGELRVYGVEKLEPDKLRLRDQAGTEVVFVTR